jgi:hypothetical protein
MLRNKTELEMDTLNSYVKRKKKRRKCSGNFVKGNNKFILPQKKVMGEILQVDSDGYDLGLQKEI